MADNRYPVEAHVQFEDIAEEWSCGNPFYYGYGFDIAVVPADA